MGLKDNTFIHKLISDLKDKDFRINQLETEVHQKAEVIRQLKDLVKGIEKTNIPH